MSVGIVRIFLRCVSFTMWPNIHQNGVADAVLCVTGIRRRRHLLHVTGSSQWCHKVDDSCHGIFTCNDVVADANTSISHFMIQ